MSQWEREVHGDTGDQRYKDRSKIRGHMVIRKPGCGDEGETRKGELGEYPEMGVCGKIRGSGKILGRSIDLWEYGVQECQRRRK